MRIDCLKLFISNFPERSLVIHLEVVLREAQEMLETATVAADWAQCEEDEASVSRVLQIRAVLETYISAVNTRLYRPDSLPALFRAGSEVSALLNADKNYIPFR